MDAIYIAYMLVHTIRKHIRIYIFCMYVFVYSYLYICICIYVFAYVYVYIFIHYMEPGQLAGRCQNQKTNQPVFTMPAQINPGDVSIWRSFSPELLNCTKLAFFKRKV